MPYIAFASFQSILEWSLSYSMHFKNSFIEAKLAYNRLHIKYKKLTYFHIHINLCHGVSTKSRFCAQHAEESLSLSRHFYHFPSWYSWRWGAGWGVWGLDGSGSGRGANPGSLSWPPAQVTDASPGTNVEHLLFELGFEVYRGHFEHIGGWELFPRSRETKA